MSIKKILVSQHTPTNLAPYNSLSEEFGVEFTFKPFFTIEPLPSRDFRAQRINLLDYTAVVFSSRHAIDAYFSLASELRIKVPETMKYFCTTEAVAMYLQKHIVYRKRKIFFGDGTPQSVVDQIGTKHEAEKFLITTSDNSRNESLTRLLDEKGTDYTSAVFVTSVLQDLKDINPHDYDMIVLYNAYDVKSIQQNWPDFQQEEIKFMAYGKTIVSSMEAAGLEIAMKAPTPSCPSVAKALQTYLKQQ